MQEVGGRPVLEYVAERMRAGGAGELRVVTRPDKEDVAEIARSLGARVIAATPRTAAESFAIAASGLEERDMALLGFPDTIWAPADGYVRLVDALERDSGAEACLGLFRLPPEELPRSDVVVEALRGTVAEVVVKQPEPPSSWIWGCAAARAGALAGLELSDEVGVHLDRLARAGKVRCVRLSGLYVDIGTKEALARAAAVARGRP